MATIAQRLREAMELRGVKQADIVQKTGINKGAISSYLSGRYAPKQNNIYLLAKALDVSEVWLMGDDDVPMDRMSDAERFARTAEIYNLTSPHLHTEQERRMMLYFRRLSDVGKERLEKLSQNLYEVEEMEKKLSERKGESDDNGKKEAHPSS